MRSLPMDRKVRIHLPALLGQEDEKMNLCREIPFEDGATYEDLAAPFMNETKAILLLARTGEDLHELGEPVAGEPVLGGPSDGEKLRNQVEREKLGGQAEREIQDITYLDTADPAGQRAYMRTLAFLFIAALDQCLPQSRAVIGHSISGGLYVQVREGEKKIIVDSRLRNQCDRVMRRMIRENRTIRRLEMSREEAAGFFRARGREDKASLFPYQEKDPVSVYELDGSYDSFYGPMAPSAAYVGDFQLVLFDDGLVLMGLEPDSKKILRNFKPQPKLSYTYREEEAWAELQGIHNVSDLNRLVQKGEIGDVVRMTEALQNHRIMEVAEEINRKNKRLVLIAAPSSSGKTSFAYKLSTHLQIMGWRPLKISMDDYFLGREETPLDKEGKKDYEGIGAIDLKKFNEDLTDLLAGKRVERIRYDFVEGRRVLTGKTDQLLLSSPLIIEGIHALNPRLISGIEDDLKFKIFLSVTTQIGLDDHNRISTTDLRLLRRIARDKEARGILPARTILNWPSVLKGERRNIFPFEEEADLLFNSAFIYEIAALKPIVYPELMAIPKSDPAYGEARRLLDFLQYFVPMEDLSDIVNTSILREFIGGSKIVG